jgi:hypothetical protein
MINNFLVDVDVHIDDREPALDVLVLEPHLGHLDPFGRIVIRVVERSL